MSEPKPTPQILGWAVRNAGTGSLIEIVPALVDMDAVMPGNYKWCVKTNEHDPPRWQIITVTPIDFIRARL